MKRSLLNFFPFILSVSEFCLPSALLSSFISGASVISWDAGLHGGFTSATATSGVLLLVFQDGKELLLPVKLFLQELEFPSFLN
jgi:hypothetical protein